MIVINHGFQFLFHRNPRKRGGIPPLSIERANAHSLYTDRLYTLCFCLCRIIILSFVLRKTPLTIHIKVLSSTQRHKNIERKTGHRIEKTSVTLLQISTSSTTGTTNTATIHGIRIRITARPSGKQALQQTSKQQKLSGFLTKTPQDISENDVLS